MMKRTVVDFLFLAAGCLLLSIGVALALHNGPLVLLIEEVTIGVFLIAFY